MTEDGKPDMRDFLAGVQRIVDLVEQEQDKIGAADPFDLLAFAVAWMCHGEDDPAETFDDIGARVADVLNDLLRRDDAADLDVDTELS